MDYILANEKDNFSIDTYFIQSTLRRIASPRSIPDASESAIESSPSDIRAEFAPRTR